MLPQSLSTLTRGIQILRSAYFKTKKNILKSYKSDFTQLFSADATMFSIAPENMKKLPSKVAHNRTKIIFFSTGPSAQMAQKQKSRTTNPVPP